MPRKILTVDDSPSIRQMVVFTLKSAGYAVVEAADGEAGVAKAMADKRGHPTGATNRLSSGTIVVPPACRSRMVPSLRIGFARFYLTSLTRNVPVALVDTATCISIS